MESFTNAVLVMVGLPACGKSTLSLMLKEKLLVFNINVYIIELDQIFNSLPPTT